MAAVRTGRHDNRAMSTSWDRRIRQITRSVKPTQLRALRGQMRKAKVRELRGLLSRNLPSEIVFRHLGLKCQRRLGSPLSRCQV